jgi:hypothetical protein
MANELPEVIPVPAALIPEAEALSSEDLIFLLQGGHFKKLPATEFKGDRGDAATGLSIGAWKVAIFKRVGGSHRLNVVYRLIKSGDDLIWLEFAGNMDVLVSTTMSYSYRQETVDGELEDALCSTQYYLIHDINSDNFTGRLAVSIAGGKITLAVSDSGSYAYSNLLWSLDGILYNVRQSLPNITPPVNSSITIDVAPTNVPNTSGSLQVTVETTNGGWFVEEASTWLSVSKTTGENGQTIVTVSWAANASTSQRIGTVVFTHSVDTILSATLQVTQAAATPAPAPKYVNVNFEKIAGTQNTDSLNVWLTTSSNIQSNVSVTVKLSSHNYSEQYSVPLVLYGGLSESEAWSHPTYLIADSDWHIELINQAPQYDNDGAQITIQGVDG